MPETVGDICKGRLLVGSATSGPLVVLHEPVSFWGGVDPATGHIVDRHHAQMGTLLSGAVVVMDGARGSSSSSSTLLECVARGTAPAALLLTQPDVLLTVGAAAAHDLYSRGPTVIRIQPSQLDRLCAHAGRRVAIFSSGRVTAAPRAFNS